MDSNLSNAQAAAGCGPEARVRKFVVLLGDSHTEGASAARIPGLIRCTRNHVMEQVKREHVASAVDAITAVDELWCAGTSPQETLAELKTIYADEPVVQISFVHERTIFARDERPGFVTRISLLQRATTLTRSQFSTYWHDVHAPLAACHRHVARYVQNHVVASTREDEPFDGIAQFLISDLVGMRADYDTDAGKAMQADVQNFAAAVSTYVVRRHPAFGA
jgi:uncharacterized protein (TIGR02118 family)